MKTPKVKFSYNYARGSELSRTVKSRALSENLFHEILYLYGDKKSIPLKMVTSKFKQFMPEKIYFNLKKLPISEWDLNGACIISHINKDGAIGRYSISVPVDGNSLELDDLPVLIHEATHLFDALLQPKTQNTISKVYANRDSEIIDEFFSSYYYCGDEDLMAKNTKIDNVRKMTNQFLKSYKIEDKLTILNYYKETMNTEFNAAKMQSLCNEILDEKIEKNDFWSFEDMDKIYHYEDKINLLNNMIKKILLKERYKTALEKSDSPMDKVKLTLEYCLKLLI